MADAVKNFSYGTVLTAPSPATSGTSLVLNSGQGALMPTPPFNATIWITLLQPTPTNAEIVTVTAIATDTLTIVRAREGTVARTVVATDQVAATITAKDLTDLAGNTAPNMNMQVLAGYSQVLVRTLTIASGKQYVLGLAAHLRIL
jgi:hypothetical protein